MKHAKLSLFLFQAGNFDSSGFPREGTLIFAWKKGASTGDEREEATPMQFSRGGVGGGGEREEEGEGVGRAGGGWRATPNAINKQHQHKSSVFGRSCPFYPCFIHQNDLFPDELHCNQPQDPFCVHSMHSDRLLFPPTSQE